MSLTVSNNDWLELICNWTDQLSGILDMPTEYDGFRTCTGEAWKIRDKVQSSEGVVPAVIRRSHWRSIRS